MFTSSIALVLDDTVDQERKSFLIRPHCTASAIVVWPARTTLGRFRSCTPKTMPQSQRILPDRTPLSRCHMAAGSSKAGRRRTPMTLGRLKRCPVGERDSFESRRVANRYSERRVAAGEPESGNRTRPPAAVMYLNGLCPSAFARRHYDACAMDTVQTDTLTDGWTMNPIALYVDRRIDVCCTRTMKLFGHEAWLDGQPYIRATRLVVTLQGQEVPAPTQCVTYRSTKYKKLSSRRNTARRSVYPCSQKNVHYIQFPKNRRITCK